MRRQSYKILLYALYLIVAIYVIGVVWWFFAIHLKDKSNLAPKLYDATIVNNNVEFSPTTDNTSAYEIPFMRIKTISFFTDNEYAYFRFGLGGTLPKLNKGLPLYDNDQLTSLDYILTLDDNYFDFSGRKNPTAAEASIDINLYGKSTGTDDNKITVNGELIKGGPGFDYFVVRYKYNEILLNQKQNYIVFTAYSIVNSKKYPSGASIFEFENNMLAATAENNKEVLIDLSLKDLKY